MLIRVAVPVPQLDLLTYGVPEGTTVPHVGARVVVPLGSRLVTGIVVETTDTDTAVSEGAGAADAAGPAIEIKPLVRVLDDAAFLPAEVVELARWTAEYYAAGTGATIMAALPPKTRGTRADAHKTQRVVAITDSGLRAMGDARPEGRAYEDTAKAVDRVPRRRS